MKKNNKIGVLTVAFAEQSFIGGCILQFNDFDFYHLVLVSERPWRGNWKGDKTAFLAEALGAEVIVGFWENQAEQFNYGLEYLKNKNIDWTLIVDADEFYTKEDIKIIIEEIQDCDVNVIDAPNMNVYWKTPEYRIDSTQTDGPVIAIRTVEKFIDKRKNESDKYPSVATLYHMSYVRTDKDMIKKICSFEHSEEFDRQKWYDQVWRKWTINSTNLHPVKPSQFERAVYDPAPLEIRMLLK